MDVAARFQRPDAPALILVSNREPFIHEREASGRIGVSAPAGGLTAALQPMLAATGGTWVAWGSGSADFDVTDATDSVRVPPENPAYRLRRLRLSPEEVSGYYVETANRVLWPLCHSQIARLVYEAEHWKTYRRVNERFAAAALSEAGGRDAVVWVQDYHLAYVPAMLRDSARLFVHQFWHIPWPSPDILRLLPPARSLVRALLGNDLLGFQTKSDCRNFFAAVRRLVPEAKVELGHGRVKFAGHRTVVRAFPISIDVQAFERAAARADVAEVTRRIRRNALPHGGQLLLGVDRVDYTKGIPRRFRAIDRLLENHPEYIGRVVLLQIAVPSRSEVPEYVAYEEEVAEMAQEVNRRYRRGDWQPIRLLREGQDHLALTAFYRAADLCMVTPLQDGMNLVAKEFVACQDGRLGALVLSRFAGAVHEMRGAFLVNPYDVSAVAETIHAALATPPEDRERRLTKMRRRLRTSTVFDWMEGIFNEVDRLRRRK
jgi:trehalose 6-phosphate synthase